MPEPDAGPSRQLIGDLIHETGGITHLAIVCRRCGPAIVNPAGVIGIDFRRITAHGYSIGCPPSQIRLVSRASRQWLARTVL
jgi:hypothetical protein